MTTPLWTNPANGRSYITVNGDQIRIDALPPEGHTPTPPVPAGYAIAPCVVCGTPLAATLALRGAHLGCLPADRAYAYCLRICGAGRIWTTLIPVYRGEQLHTTARAVRNTPANHGGVAA